MFEKELIIFDLDGTLIDSSEDIAWAVNKTLKNLRRKEMDVGLIKRSIGWGVKALLKSIMPDEPPKIIDEAREIFLDYYGGHLLVKTRFYSGVTDVLKYFNLSGKNMAVVTNKPITLTEKILDGLDVKKFFKIILGGDSVENKKPHPEPLLKVMKETGIIRQQAVFIGDGAIDCETAVKAGVAFIGAAYGFRGRHELEDAGCDIIIAEIAELKEIIK